MNTNNNSNIYLVIDSFTNQITNIIVADSDFAKSINAKPYYEGAGIGQVYNPPIDYEFPNISTQSMIQSGSYIGTGSSINTSNSNDSSDNLLTITSIDTSIQPEVAYISAVDENGNTIDNIVVNTFENYKLKVSNEFNKLGVEYKYSIIGKKI